MLVIFCLVLVLIPRLLLFIGAWDLTFDDAFISYRYAKHLASGHGLTWNIGESPTEGYTNFLLVLILAPLIKMGADPLTSTRLLNCFSVVATCLLIWRFCKQVYPNDTLAPWIASSLLLVVPGTGPIILLGLETPIYTFFLLATFLAGIDLSQDCSKKRAAIFSVLVFLTFLLRPEGILLFPVVWCGVWVAIPSKTRGQTFSLVLAPVVLTFLLGGYLLWKVTYFGSLLPNPFFIKAYGKTWLSPFGIQSVRDFIQPISHQILLMLAFLSLGVLPSATESYYTRTRAATILSLVSSEILVLFFLRVDTLMDFYGRFLYPVIPLLIIAASRSIHVGLQTLCKRRVTFFCGGLLVLCLGLQSIKELSDFKEKTALAKRDDGRGTLVRINLMQRELEIGKQLALYPDIQRVRIAFGDSGVIPYFTESIWLDTVGLNDAFIARNRDLNKLLSYLFDWRADILILPSLGTKTWLTFGHGPLGNIPVFSSDPRFDEFEYIGTALTDAYDLQFYISKRSSLHHELKLFVRNEIIDGFFSAPPLSLGAYKQVGQSEWNHVATRP